MERETSRRAARRRSGARRSARGRVTACYRCSARLSARAREGPTRHRFEFRNRPRGRVARDSASELDVKLAVEYADVPQLGAGVKSRTPRAPRLGAATVPHRCRPHPRQLAILCVRHRIRLTLSVAAFGWSSPSPFALRSPTQLVEARRHSSVVSLSAGVPLRVITFRPRCRSTRFATGPTSARVEQRSINADAGVNGRVDHCIFVTIAGIPVVRSYERNLVDVEALTKVCVSIFAVAHHRRSQFRSVS